MEMIDFNAKKGFLCDMDGVIYHGNHILPGAAEFIHWLQDTHKEYLFLTNNSGMTPRHRTKTDHIPVPTHIFRAFFAPHQVFMHSFGAFIHVLLA